MKPAAFPPPVSALFEEDVSRGCNHAVALIISKFADVQHRCRSADDAVAMDQTRCLQLPGQIVVLIDGDTIIFRTILRISIAKNGCPSGLNGQQGANKGCQQQGEKCQFRVTICERQNRAVSIQGLGMPLYITVECHVPLYITNSAPHAKVETSWR